MGELRASHSKSCGKGLKLMRILTRKRDFFRSDKDLFARCSWLAEKVHHDIALLQSPTAPSAFFNDPRFQEQDRREHYELIAYTMSFVVRRLRDDIAHRHGWDERAEDLHHDYMMFLYVACGYACGLSDGDETFLGLFVEYYQPVYAHDYMDFWGIPRQRNDRPQPHDELFNVDRFLVFRLNAITPVTDRERCLQHHTRLYREVGSRHYETFSRYSMRAIMREMKKMLR